MKFRKTPPTEQRVQSAIRRRLEKAGWLVEKSHGNRFQVGWPDLFVSHPEKGMKWIEVKRPKTGRLTPGQKSRFALWESFGAGVWVLSAVDQVPLLDGEPNWRDWL